MRSDREQQRQLFLYVLYRYAASSAASAINHICIRRFVAAAPSHLDRPIYKIEIYVVELRNNRRKKKVLDFCFHIQCIFISVYFISCKVQIVLHLVIVFTHITSLQLTLNLFFCQLRARKSLMSRLFSKVMFVIYVHMIYILYFIYK